MAKNRQYADKVDFFRSWVVDPKRVGAVMPSGESLAHLITRDIHADLGPVMELGPGTGVFTRAMLAKGVDERNLTLVESGQDFAQTLADRFPKAEILCMDAARLATLERLPERAPAAVVSGLPLLSMSPRKVMMILSGSFRQIREGGSFYQFTYGVRCPVSRAILERLNLRAVRIGRAIRNIPPAAVYRISRKDGD